MTHSEMEDALKNLDRRVSSVEHILPTLATKTDVGRVREEFRDGHADAKIHSAVLVESVREDIRFVAGGVASLVTKVDSLIGRLEQKGVI